jgi:hypothetical protein
MRRIDGMDRWTDGGLLNTTIRINNHYDAKPTKGTTNTLSGPKRAQASIQWQNNKSNFDASIISMTNTLMKDSLLLAIQLLLFVFKETQSLFFDWVANFHITTLL